MAAITPMTIPAIAPPLNPCELLATTAGLVLVAVAGVANGCVVVVETVDVFVVTPPLVPFTGGENVLVLVVAVVVPLYVQLDRPPAGMSAHCPE